MDDIIKNIIDIEEKAQRIMSDTNQDEENFAKILSEKVAKLHEDILGRADKKIAELNSKEDGKDIVVDKKQQKSYDSLISDMKRNYNANKEDWINNIVNNVIGRDELC